MRGEIKAKQKSEIGIANPVDMFMAVIQQQRQEIMEENEDRTGKDGNSER